MKKNDLKQQSNPAAKRHIAHFATTGKLDVIENWLRRNTKSKWTLKTEGVSDDLSTKKYMISFGDRNEYDAFRRRFTPSPAINA